MQNKKNYNDLSEENAREFLQSTFESYPYHLQNNINQYIEESVTSALFEIKTGGSSGGNCWGDYTQQFRVSREEQQEDLIYEIKHRFITRINEYTNNKYDVDNFEKILKDVAKDNEYNSITTTSSYGDYYGNGSDYDIIAVPIMDTLRKILDYTDYCTVEAVFEEEKTKRFDELNQTKNKENLVKVSKAIADFEKNKNAAEKSIHNDIEKAKKLVASLEKKLTTFDKEKAKELDNLQKEETRLKNELGISHNTSSIKKKK